MERSLQMKSVYHYEEEIGRWSATGSLALSGFARGKEYKSGEFKLSVKETNRLVALAASLVWKLNQENSHEPMFTHEAELHDQVHAPFGDSAHAMKWTILSVAEMHEQAGRLSLDEKATRTLQNLVAIEGEVGEGVGVRFSFEPYPGSIGSDSVEWARSLRGIAFGCTDAEIPLVMHACLQNGWIQEGTGAVIGTVVHITPDGYAKAQMAALDASTVLAGVLPEDFSIEESVRLQERVLTEVHKAARGLVGRPVDCDPIKRALGINDAQLNETWRQLSGKGLLESHRQGDKLAITALGVKQVEARHMNDIQEVRFQFLKAVYDLSGADTLKTVSVSEAAVRAGVPDSDLRAVLSYLTQSGLITGPLGGVKCRLTTAGIDEFEAKSRQPESPTQHFTSNISIGTVQGSFSSIVGNENKVSQSTTITIEQAIEGLREGLTEADGGSLHQDSEAPLDALMENDVVRTTSTADIVAKKGPAWLGKLKDFCSRAAASGVGGAAVLALKAILAAHGIVLP